MSFVTAGELQAGLDHVRSSPVDDGVVRLLVRRPAVEAREVVESVRLSQTHGVVGDTWRTRTYARDKAPDPDEQLAIVNARALEVLSPDETRWPLAGDQLYLDVDLSADNTPAGTRLAIGTAIIEITAVPHTGCAKFRHRFGEDALRWVNSEDGKHLRLRGVHARVVADGTVSVGDRVQRA